MMVKGTREHDMLQFQPSVVAATALMVGVRSELRARAGDAGRDARRGHPGSEPTEEQLFAATGHTLGEVRRCEGVFARDGVLEQPFRCHSILHGSRASKSIVLTLDLSDPSRDVPTMGDLLQLWTGGAGGGQAAFLPLDRDDQ